jgi:hypothetical protein
MSEQVLYSYNNNNLVEVVLSMSKPFEQASLSSFSLSYTCRIFVDPLYCGVLLCESLMVNRRRDDEEQLESDKMKVIFALPCRF